MPHFKRNGVSSAHLGSGALGDGCLNRWGLKPVIDHRNAGTVDRAENCSSEGGRVPKLEVFTLDHIVHTVHCLVYDICVSYRLKYLPV